MKVAAEPITVIGSAAFLGVMLAIGLGLVPFFYLADQSAFEDWFAEYFVFFLPAVCITSVPALIGSITLMRRSTKGSQERHRWRNTMLGLVSVYGVTTAVHLPLNIAFWSRELTESAFVTSLGLWTAAHILRIAGAGFAAYSAFHASQLPKGQPT
jgi:hypothetical protein